jgi:hypothetical protein
LATTSDAYIKIIHRDLKREVVDIVYDGELQIENMKLNIIEEITKAYDSWTTYKENIALRSLHNFVFLNIVH